MSCHLLGIEQLSKMDIQTIFKYAATYRKELKQPNGCGDLLANNIVVLLFCEPSTRTRVSFEVAAKKLGANVINIMIDGSSIQKGETLLDTLHTLQALQANFVVMRHACSGIHYQLAPQLNISLINAGDGTHEHPTQALLDAFTLQEKLQTLKDKNISIIGDILHSRVARSNILLLHKLGAHITLCGPRALLPIEFKKMNVTVTYDLKEALINADVLNVLRIQKERQKEQFIESMSTYIKNYGINEEKLKKYAKKNVLICHPGPVNREVELTASLIDGQRSMILSQVKNGVFIRMAIFRWLHEAGNNE